MTVRAILFGFALATSEAVRSLFSREVPKAVIHVLGEIEYPPYCYIEVDEQVGLLAVVGEGMQGKPGLAGRIFTAISREDVNIIAIAQGSSELTIAIVVARDGLEKAVRAVHAECGMGA